MHITDDYSQWEMTTFEVFQGANESESGWYPHTSMLCFSNIIALVSRRWPVSSWLMWSAPRAYIDDYSVRGTSRGVGQ